MNVTLEAETDQGLTPVVLALQHHNMHAFIYLHYKLRCSLPVEKACWATTQIVKQYLKDNEILELLFHDENVGREVAYKCLQDCVQH